MPNFEINEKCEIERNNVTTDEVIQLLQYSLSKYYNEGDITITSNGITIDGDLSSFWERAITNANATIKIDNNKLIYKVEGSSNLGRWPCFWLIISFFVLPFIIFFIIDLVEFTIGKDRPKYYFEEAFKYVKFELEK